jgi:hypothetical protein
MYIHLKSPQSRDTVPLKWISICTTCGTKKRPQGAHFAWTKVTLLTLRDTYLRDGIYAAKLQRLWPRGLLAEPEDDFCHS